MVLDIRRRTGYLLLMVLLAQVILVSAQVNTRSGTRVIEAITFGVLSEVQRAVAGVIRTVSDVWSGYFALRGVREQNVALRRQVDTLQVALQQQRALAQRTERLQALLALQQGLSVPTLAAEVIASDATPWFRTVTVNRGTTDGVHRDMAVIAPAGVVGRVVQPGTRAAMVQLLVDRNAAAGALIERSRAAGVVTGGDGDPPLRMEFVSNLVDVRVGDVVVTSGIDRIYPKGFIIGHVELAERGPGLHRTIRVRPSVDFASLEEVLVVTAFPAVEGPEGGE